MVKLILVGEMERQIDNCAKFKLWSLALILMLVATSILFINDVNT